MPIDVAAAAIIALFQTCRLMQARSTDNTSIRYCVTGITLDAFQLRAPPCRCSFRRYASCHVITLTYPHNGTANVGRLLIRRLLDARCHYIESSIYNNNIKVNIQMAYIT